MGCGNLCLCNFVLSHLSNSSLLRLTSSFVAMNESSETPAGELKRRLGDVRANLRGFKRKKKRCDARVGNHGVTAFLKHMVMCLYF